MYTIQQSKRKEMMILTRNFRYPVGLAFIFCWLYGCSTPATGTPQVVPDWVFTAAVETIQAQATATPSQMPSSTPTTSPVTVDVQETPSPTPTEGQPEITQSASAALASVTANTNCRNGPGPEFDIVGYVLVGDKVEVRGRHAVNGWWYVQNPTLPGGFCWVWGETTQVSGNESAIPIIVPGPTLTYTPIPADTQTPVLTPRPTETGNGTPSPSPTSKNAGLTLLVDNWVFLVGRASPAPPETPPALPSTA